MKKDTFSRIKSLPFILKAMGEPRNCMDSEVAYQSVNYSDSFQVSVNLF